MYKIAKELSVKILFNKGYFSLLSTNKERDLKVHLRKVII